MKKKIFLIIINLLITINLHALDYKQNEIIIKTKEPLESLKIASSIRNAKDPIFGKYKIKNLYNLKIKKSDTQNLHTFQKNSYDRIYQIILDQDINVMDVVKEFNKSNQIEWAQPNFIYKISATTFNDTYFSKQWNLVQINALDAWDNSLGTASVVVAVVDTGVNWQHEDLSTQIWSNTKEIANDGIDNDGNGFIDDIRGWDFVSRNVITDSYTGDPIDEDYETKDNNPMDVQGHGTLVASIIAAIANNNKGIAGIAPHCKIMPLRAGYKTLDGGGVLETVDATEAIQYAVDNGAKIINISWGGDQGSSIDDIALKITINNAIQKGVTIVAAAGNSGRYIDFEPYIPACLDGVIAVSATDSDGDFDISYSNYGNSIDLSAPGTKVYGALFNGTDYYYDVEIGTSFSAPHVSGVAALLLSFNPNITSADVYTALTKTATDKGSIGKDIFYGYGIVNAVKALGYIDPTAPVVSHTALSQVDRDKTITINATITDNFNYTGVPSATLYYRANNESNWNSVNMTNSGSNFTGLIPNFSSLVTDFYYYLKVSDLNPDNNFYVPSTKGYNVKLTDIIGPVISKTLEDNDYISSDQIIHYSIKDTSGVSLNTCEVGIIQEDSTVTTYNISSSVLSYSDDTLSIDLSKLNLDAQNLTFRITLADNAGNYTRDFTQTLILTGDNSKFKLIGPYENTPIINYPNPFNPQKETTKICYMISHPADVTILIYSLNLQLVKRINRTDSTGYHEVVWDGYDNNGIIVPPGVYLTVIRACSQTNSSIITKRIKIAIIN